MSTNQPPTEEKPETAARRPGFFSRLIGWKTGESPAPEPAPPAPEPVVAEPPPAPAAPEPPARKPTLFERLFGSAKPAPEAPAAPAPAPEPEPLAEASPATEKGWFARLAERLGQSSQNLVGRLRRAIGLGARLDEETLEAIEEILIQSDVRFETTTKLIERLRQRARKEDIVGRDAILDAVKTEIEAILLRKVRVFDPRNVKPPYVVLVVGVNGVGKTTTIAKMAKRSRDAGLSVMVIAGDTFRAAAVDQLQVWADRVGASFVSAGHGADPSALVFDGLARARAEGTDVVFIDTAGRLHTKSNLMAELGKIERVIKKQIPEAPHETLLVIDATTGQNGIQQVRLFSQVVGLNGIVMTKLDGTAKGGMLISIRDEFEVPVTLVGVGEGVGDLRDFDPEQYVEALFASMAER